MLCPLFYFCLLFHFCFQLLHRFLKSFFAFFHLTFISFFLCSSALFYVFYSPSKSLIIFYCFVIFSYKIETITNWNVITKNWTLRTIQNDDDVDGDDDNNRHHKNKIARVTVLLFIII